MYESCYPGGDFWLPGRITVVLGLMIYHLLIIDYLYATYRPCRRYSPCRPFSCRCRYRLRYCPFYR